MKRKYAKKAFVIYLEPEDFDKCKEYMKKNQEKGIKCNWHTLVVPNLLKLIKSL